MAGIYDRVGGDPEHRVSIEAIFQSMILRALSEYTSQEALDAVNESTDLPLEGDEITDLQAILAEMVSQSTNTNRLVYLNKAKAVFHQWEQGITVMSESRGRSVLSIA